MQRLLHHYKEFSNTAYSTGYAHGVTTLDAAQKVPPPPPPPLRPPPPLSISFSLSPLKRIPCSIISCQGDCPMHQQPDVNYIQVLEKVDLP